MKKYTIPLIILTSIVLFACERVGTPENPATPILRTYKLPDGRLVDCIIPNTTMKAISCNWNEIRPAKPNNVKKD